MTTTFAALGVPDDIVAALARRGITEPFAIQAATIADGLAGRDLCGKAATGSGKTIAFGVPLVARVTRSAPKRPKGLVLAPTRELANQVADELTALTSDLRVLAVYGGAGIEPQIKKLRAGVDIVVATPGRLLDLMDKRVCDLRDVTVAVLDEADRMADMGFLPDVRRILDQTPDTRQTVLFSATLDGAIDELVRRYQRNPVVHEVAEDRSGTTTHHLWECERQGRVHLVAEMVERLGPTVVFCRTKHGSDRVARQLGNAGVKAAAIHGNRSQGQRERALAAFHRGDIAALVATDVAARGIHVEGVAGVIHFDLPGDPKDYIHRSGRTGRAGSDGTVVALFDAGQRKDAKAIVRAVDLGVELGTPDVASLPEGPQQPYRKPRRGREASGGERRQAPARSGSKPKPRTERPRAERPEAEARSSSPSKRARAERRATQFSDEERARRAAAKQRSGGERSLPEDLPGAAKVRPSGASRRKAKRAALAAAGEPVPRSKKKRSGKPRPPASSRSGARSGGRPPSRGHR
ncbi:MAG: DEAD/DEAH box helicase [Acidimicrobiales bacterium]|nr:DEAD/DEAH box helicase [Acidimicrobiales bacterium]